MSLIDRLHERRQRLLRERPKGSFLFWYCMVSLALQVLRMWGAK